MATVAGSQSLLDISGNNITTAVSLEAGGTLLDTSGDAGTSGQVLSSTATGVNWVTANPGDITGVTASSPLTGGGTSGTVTVGIQTASASQAGALSAANWTTFNNKTSNTGTVTSVGTTGTVSGLTLTGTVTTSGNLTLGGTLSLTSANVTTGLGFTPYNATNPAGYTTNTGTTTASNTQTFTNKSGSNNQWTNDSGYITAAALPAVSDAIVTVTTGTGLDGATTFTLNQAAAKTIALTLDLNELGAGGTLVATDSLVAVNGTAGNKQLISSIPLSIFNNNSSWTSNTGTVTSVNASIGGSAIGVTGGAITTAGTLAFAFAGGAGEYIDGAGDLQTFPPTGDITGVTAGTGMTGGGATGTVTLNVIGGTGITANANDIAIDATVATLAGTQTFTNKSGSNNQWTNDAGYITGVDWTEIAGDPANINISGFNNDAGYTTNTGDITGVTAGTNLNGGGATGAVTLNLDATIAITSAAIGSTVTLSESTDRADLLYVNSGTSTWGGLQIGNTSNEFIFSLMGDGSVGGIYDDQNSQWIIQWTENSGTKFYQNGGERLSTTSTGINVNGDSGSGGAPTAAINVVGGYITATDASGYGVAFMEGASIGEAYFGNEGTGEAYFGNSESYETLVAKGGKIGIGWSYGQASPAYALDVTGTIRASGDVIAYSDARVKENVETIPNALDKVKAMRGVGYNKIGEERRSVGVIAQELLEVLPEVVHQDEQGMYSVAYGNIVGVLIEAMKEQQSQINELKEKLDGLTK